MIEQVLSIIEEYGINTERIDSNIDFADPKDIVFYEVSLSKEQSFLITGNTKHFPKKPFIITPSEMITILESINDQTNRVLSEPKHYYK